MEMEQEIRNAVIEYSDMLYHMVRFRIRHPKVCIDELKDSLAAPEQKETLKELLDLPVRQKTVLYLHYVEGYRIKEIADILGTTEGAVKMRLRRGRKQMQISRSMRGGHFRKRKSS